MPEQARPHADTEEIIGGADAPPGMTMLPHIGGPPFDQAVKQVQKANACSDPRGGEIAGQAHNTGKAVVKIGADTECVRVGNILAAIGLVVTVVQAWPPAESNAHRAPLRRDLSA